MVKTKKLLLAMGVAAGLGIAGLPLTSYAASDAVNVSVTVDSTIALSITNKSINLGTLTPGSASATGKSTVVTVNSNNVSGYSLTVAGTSLTGGTGTTAIIYDTVGTVTSAWGISVGTDSGYSGLTSIASTTAPSAAAGDTYTIYFGARASAIQQNGTYTGTATFTATNK